LNHALWLQVGIRHMFANRSWGEILIDEERAQEQGVALKSEAAALVEKISLAIRLVTPDAPMHAHTAWECCEMLEQLETGDFTPVEMMALAALLSGVNARRLSGIPTLRLVADAG
jgi:hypothetical protein